MAAKLLPKMGALKWFANWGEEKSSCCPKGLLVMNETSSSQSNTSYSISWFAA